MSEVLSFLGGIALFCACIAVYSIAVSYLLGDD